MSKILIEVMVLGPFHSTFTYSSSEELAIGTVVQVCFNKRSVWGVVWRISDGCDKKIKVKEVSYVHRFFALSKELVGFIEMYAAYTITPVGTVLKNVLPGIEKRDADMLYMGNSFDEPTSLKEMKAKTKMPLKELNKLCEDGSIYPVACEYKADTVSNVSAIAPISLSEHQIPAFDVIRGKIAEGGFSAGLLYGVTGSGKTEVCIKLCTRLWREGKQVLILLPEIALIQQWEQRVRKYFDMDPVIWHSSVSPAKRKKAFEAIYEGRAQCIIGARSSIFLPYKRLGLVIVDEEHDSSYKQDDGFLYNGRDAAVLRSKRSNIPIILSSATPSIESEYNVSQGKYYRASIFSRHSGSEMPRLHVVDMKKYNTMISLDLRLALEATLKKGQQSILFLNKRGHSSVLLCKQCGWRAECDSCDAWCTVHKSSSFCKYPHMICHYCGSVKKLPEKCPACTDERALFFYGPGVEKVKEEVASIFPKARVAIFSSDYLKSSAKIESIIEKVHNKDVDILVGTQMISKGHHFPGVTCVGIIDGDFGMDDIDFRSMERAYHTLSQVSGRAGRGSEPGNIYFQTHRPDSYLVKHFIVNARESFVKTETTYRLSRLLPPFIKLIGLVVSGDSDLSVREFCIFLHKGFPFRIGDAEIIGPAPAIINPINKRYRWRFLIRISKEFNICQINNQVQSWIKKSIKDGRSADIRVRIDVDPYHFF